MPTRVGIIFVRVSSQVFPNHFAVKPQVTSTAHLARHLGLSRWTVSRALNNHPGVRRRTVERLRRAMQELHFEPNPFARGLRGGRTALIGICIQELENLNLTSKISDLQHRLRENHYRGLIEFTMGQPSMEERVIRHFVGMRVEGVVIVASSQTSRSAGLQMLRKNQVPTIFIDPLEENVPGSISVDRRQAMRLVIDHLHGLGHRQFAALGMTPDVPYGVTRLTGLQMAFRQRALLWRENLTVFSEKKPGNLDFAYGWRLAERFIQKRCRATAILALNDRIAFGAMRRLQQHGCRLPQDISLVGYDNIDLAAFCSPTLTTIDTQVDRLIDRTTELLYSQIRGQTKSHGEPLQIAPLLVQRESTATPPSKSNPKFHD
jgi:DNA-binding LacI/PurR family transcriptional regulator